MEQTLFTNAFKDDNFHQKNNVYMNRPPRTKKHTQAEIIMDFLRENPDSWFYIWEIMGDKRLGFVSYKCNTRVSELIKDGLIETRTIGKYSVYSLKTV